MFHIIKPAALLVVGLTVTGTGLIVQAVEVPRASGIDAGTVGLIVGGVVTILASVTASIVSIITALAGNRKADAQSVQLRGVAESAAKIEGHVNSEKTASEGRENAQKLEATMLREQLAHLQKELEESRMTARLLAQASALIPALASTPSGASPAPVTVPIPTASGLAQPVVVVGQTETLPVTIREDEKKHDV